MMRFVEAGEVLGEQGDLAELFINEAVDDFLRESRCL